MEAIKVGDLGKHVGVVRSTSWFTVTQDMINKFADVSDDHQFIHVDPEQAAPIFGSTIAQTQPRHARPRKTAASSTCPPSHCPRPASRASLPPSLPDR